MAERWTPEEDEEFRRRWARGDAVGVLARRFSRSKASIAKRRAVLRLPPRVDALRPVAPVAEYRADPLVLAVERRRRELRMTHRALAAKAGIASTALSMWLREGRSPTLAVFGPVAEALGLTIMLEVSP